MSEISLKRSQEFMDIINQIRNSIGTKLLSTEELLFITADEIARSYTMNEEKPVSEEDSHSS
ncbi:MAG TPA: hypothetical protein VHO70_13040 [Chitinispirillaceae bacterium]|nr:hypothetical protein [Chitinispirillaceae bacterium]